MSQLPAHSTPVTLGFLTVLQEPSGWLGGYLVTNGWGRPLEFRLTTAVQPNRVQTASTARRYRIPHADLIGKTLVEKTAAKPDLIVTDAPAALAAAVARRDAGGRAAAAGRPPTPTPLDHPRAARGAAASGAVRDRPRRGRRRSSTASTRRSIWRAVRPDPRGDRRGPQDGGDQPCRLTDHGRARASATESTPTASLRSEFAATAVRPAARSRRPRSAAAHRLAVGAVARPARTDRHDGRLEVPRAAGRVRAARRDSRPTRRPAGTR